VRPKRSSNVDDTESEAMYEVTASCRGGVHGDGGQAGTVPPEMEKERMELEMRRTQTMLDAQQLFLGAFLGN
jgi:hypothetical protein